jgi:TetR/AcrR family transcriptional regulator
MQLQQLLLFWLPGRPLKSMLRMIAEYYHRMKSTIPPKQRILKCAVLEFSRHGYSGAHMSRIARQAKISKRMLFYYFVSKKRLFEVVIESAWANGDVLVMSPRAAVEMPAFWSAFYLRNRDWTKLWAWEGLEWKKKGVLREKERRDFWKKALEMFKASTGPGGYPPSLDGPFTLFGLVAMEMAPVLFPNLAHLILNKDTEDPAFQRQWLSFMRTFSEVLMRSDLLPKKESAETR